MLTLSGVRLSMLTYPRPHAMHVTGGGVKHLRYLGYAQIVGINQLCPNPFYHLTPMGTSSGKRGRVPINPSLSLGKGV